MAKRRPAYQKKDFYPSKLVLCPPTPVPWFPRALGLSVFAGLALMYRYYHLGVLVVFIGFGIWLWEACVDPWVLNRSLQFQISLIVLVLLWIDIFCIGVVGIQAPIAFQSYAMRNGYYPPNTNIAGIIWDSRLTDLRVVITNPIDDDYENLDVKVQPDRWTYRAALLNNPGCDLSPMGGNTISSAVNAKGGATTITSTRIGTGFDFQDNVGDVFTVLATEHGYRLRCTTLPAHYTIQLVFAIVSVQSELLRKIGLPHNEIAQGKSGMTIAEIAGTKSSFDILGIRPSPSIVVLDGSYTRKFKPFKIAKTLSVADGN
jgi:hypothetical protein